MPKIYDLTGQTFGRLTVIRLGSPQGRHRRWLCECACGRSVLAMTANLMSKHSRSCGCLISDTTRERSSSHGHAKPGRLSRTYIVWSNMKARCLNPTATGYRRYGARGITVCQRWMDFENFLLDMGERPPGGTIDRIDGTGNYEPSNCRWLTVLEQNRNRKDNRMLTARGRTACVAEWATIARLNPKTIRARLAKGWDHERTLFTPRGG